MVPGTGRGRGRLMGVRLGDLDALRLEACPARPGDPARDDSEEEDSEEAPPPAPSSTRRCRRDLRDQGRRGRRKSIFPWRAATFSFSLSLSLSPLSLSLSSPIPFSLFPSLPLSNSLSSLSLTIAHTLSNTHNCMQLIASAASLHVQKYRMQILSLSLSLASLHIQIPPCTDIPPGHRQ